jgi:guanosine-3',5'-bis(diphosphate) 3'-pyrophosphohydrolase
MNKLDEAIMLATQAHAGQVDKGRQPYILHPLRVMLACKTEDERIAAVLHDTVEDTEVTSYQIMRQFGFVIEDAVGALTRRIDEAYPAFIERCAANPIARVVKLADIADNMDLTRLGREPTAEDCRRLTRYADALNVLGAIRGIAGVGRGK